MARPGEGRNLPGASPWSERRGRGCARRRTALAAAVSGRPDGGGSDDGHAGRRDDGARRPLRLLRPGDGRRAAREGGRPRVRGWGRAWSAPSHREVETRRGGSRSARRHGRGSPWISPAFALVGRPEEAWGAPGRPGDGRGRGGEWRRRCADDSGDGDGAVVRDLSVDDVAEDDNRGLDCGGRRGGRRGGGCCGRLLRLVRGRGQIPRPRPQAGSTSPPAARARAAASQSTGADARTARERLLPRGRGPEHALLNRRHGRRHQLLHRRREYGWRLLRKRRARMRAGTALSLEVATLGGASLCYGFGFICWRWDGSFVGGSGGGGGGGFFYL